MSIEATATVTCPSCGEDFETKYWKSLNAQIDPEAKEDLLSGKIFNIACTKCNATHSIAYPMLYHDMDHKIMIQLSLCKEDNDAYIKDITTVNQQMQSEFPDTASRMDGYQHRIANSINDLREKAMIFDASLDDRVVELVKLFVRNRLSETNPELAVNTLLFYPGTPYKLIIFADNDTRQNMTEFDKEFYDIVEAKFKERIEEHSAGCFVVDFEWAINVLSGENNNQSD